MSKGAGDKEEEPSLSSSSLAMGGLIPSNCRREDAVMDVTEERVWRRRVKAATLAVSLEMREVLIFRGTE